MPGGISVVTAKIANGGASSDCAKNWLNAGILKYVSHIIYFNFIDCQNILKINFSELIIIN